jgi:U3 small nucleolar RNA-associated protein 20
MIVDEMKTHLDRGYQLHVFLYTLHYLLNHLTQNASSGTVADHTVSIGLKTGQITSLLIATTSDLLTREMFGDLYEERMLTDTKKKHIKESKARKAFPIFEVYAEYIDFSQSFLDLIAPIIKVLESNPNINRISQCEELLSKISNSLLKNKSLNGDQLLVFLYSIVDRGIKMSEKTKINDEKQARDYGEKPEFVKKSEM